MRNILILGFGLLVSVANADPWYNTNSLAWSITQPDVGSVDGKAYPKGYKSAELSARQGWVELIGGRDAWVINGATARPKTANELKAEADQRTIEQQQNALQAERRERAESSVGIYDPIEIIAALAKIENARINAIIDRIIQINPASSNALLRARLTNEELKNAIRGEVIK